MCSLTRTWLVADILQVNFANGSSVCPPGYILSLSGNAGTGIERQGEGICAFCQVQN
jgi:hypothetical protein